MMKSLMRVNIHGVNISKLYKLLKNNQIVMKDICRKDYKTLIFATFACNQKKLIALLKNSCYTITVEEYYGPKKWLNFFSKRIGYVVGAICFAVIMTLSNFFVTDIKIYGLNTINQQSVTKFLKDNGIAKGSFVQSIDPSKVSNALSSQFEQISLVSVIKKGTSIIINIKEKQSLSSDTESLCDLVATKSGEVLEISVMEGTANVKVNDCFNAGDILIYGHFNDIYGNQVQCHAKGSIKAKIKYTISIDFYNEATVYKRTGKSVTNSKYWLFGWNFKSTQKAHNFEHFESEEYTETLFKNNFLPIKAEYQKFYETKPVLVKQNFETQKSALIEQAKENAKNMVEDCNLIVNQFEEIKQTEFGYTVCYTFETIEQI